MSSYPVWGTFLRGGQRGEREKKADREKKRLWLQTADAGTTFADHPNQFTYQQKLKKKKKARH